MDFRGLACLVGATVLVGACVTDVMGNNNFTPVRGVPRPHRHLVKVPRRHRAPRRAVRVRAQARARPRHWSQAARPNPAAPPAGGSDPCVETAPSRATKTATVEMTGSAPRRNSAASPANRRRTRSCRACSPAARLDAGPASCRYDTSQCVYCGDGELNGNEVCELDMPIETRCSELGKGTAGKLLCMDTCQVDTAACTECGFQFDFEGEQCDEWSTLITTGAAANPTSWECGNPGAFPAGPGAGKTGVWATSFNGNYLSSESGFVRSGNLDLSNCGEQTVTLTMRHWFDFQGGPSNADGAVV